MSTKDANIDERNMINTTKGALMVTVVLGHFLQVMEWHSPSTLKPFFQAVVLFIYSFHMPLFVFVSGYLSSNVDKRRDNAFKELFIPYCIFQIAFIFLRTLTGNSLEIENAIIPQFGLWYILSLFIWRILLKDLLKIKHILFISATLSILTFLFTDIGKEIALNRTIGFMFFFLAGYYFKCNHKTIHIHPIICIVFFSIEMAVYVLCNSGQYNTILDVFCHKNEDNDFSYLWALVLYGLAFVLAFTNGFLFINVLPKSSKILETVGSNTLSIYISHLAIYILITNIKMSGLLQVILAIIAIPVSLILFTSRSYRTAFNKTVSFITNLFIISDR